MIYGYHLAIGRHERVPASADSQITDTELSHATRLIWLTFAALLVQLGALSMLASMAHPATVLIGGAIIVISYFRQTANQWQLESRFPKSVVRFSITLGLAIILLATSLTPYLARFPTEDACATDKRANTEHSIPKPAGRSAKRKASFLQTAGSWFRRFLADGPQSSAKGRLGDGASSSPRPYPALQALFGEPETASGSESSSIAEATGIRWEP